ncbi:hypothetical protein D3C81_703920 [compost metagenome]
MHSIFSLPLNSSSTISNTLDFPAPQSPCIPIDIGFSLHSLINSITVLAIALLLSISTLVSLSDKIMLLPP